MCLIWLLVIIARREDRRVAPKCTGQHIRMRKNSIGIGHRYALVLGRTTGELATTLFHLLQVMMSIAATTSKKPFYNMWNSKVYPRFGLR